MARATRLESAMVTGAPKTVLGLFVAGGLLIALQGVLVLAFLGGAANHSVLFPGTSFALAGLSIVLGGATLLEARLYARSPSMWRGAPGLLLGILSFFLADGFAMGGILVVTAGGMACFARGKAKTSTASRPRLPQKPTPLKSTVVGPPPTSRKSSCSGQRGPNDGK